MDKHTGCKFFICHPSYPAANVLVTDMEFGDFSRDDESE